MTATEFCDAVALLATKDVLPGDRLRGFFTAALASADVYVGRSVTEEEWLDFCREMFKRLRGKGATFEKVVFS